MNRQQRRQADKKKAKVAGLLRSPLAFINDIGSLQTQIELANAEKMLKSHLKENPEFTQGWFSLAQIARIKGESEQAVVFFRNAIALKPDFIEAYKDLAYTKKFSGLEDEDFKRLLALDPQKFSHLPAEQRCKLDFALGKAWQDIKEYDKAFAAFDRANSTLRSSYNYDIAGLEKYFGEIADIFSADFVARHAQSGHESEKPIFIVGMPRSGTTLAEQILSSHSDVHGAGELKTLDAIMSFLQNGKKESLVNSAFMNQLGAPHFRQIGQMYVQETEKTAPDVTRITDKMPFNFMWIGLIRLALPNARIIHCRRDARDVALSCFTRMFTELTPWSNDLEDIGRYHNAYDRLMKHWKTVFGDSIYDLDYEALTAEPEKEIRKLLDYCGLEWQDACLDFHDNKRIVATASDTQVRKPIYKDSAGSWKRYEKHIEPLIKILESA